MSGQLYPLFPQPTGIAQIVQDQDSLSSLESMILKDMTTISDPTASMADKVTAFNELSQYVTGSSYQNLESSFDDTQKALLKTDLQTCLKSFNDVEIPVGRNDDGSTKYARVYTDANQTVPATAADLLAGWLNNNTDSAAGTNFYFSYSDEPNGDNYTPPWSDVDNNYMQGGCSTHQTHDTNSDPSKDISVNTTRNDCSNTSNFNCQGDAQAIAGFCDYNHMDSSGNDVPYNFSGAFNDYLANNDWSQLPANS